jgi:hypothetical protein
LFITENPEESLITTLESTVYDLVAGGLITLFIMNEKVPVVCEREPILKEISDDVNTDVPLLIPRFPLVTVETEFP